MLRYRIIYPELIIVLWRHLKHSRSIFYLVCTLISYYSVWRHGNLTKTLLSFSLFPHAELHHAGCIQQTFAVVLQLLADHAASTEEVKDFFFFHAVYHGSHLTHPQDF